MTTGRRHDKPPGWWPSLVQAVCSCGWRGPVRDANAYTWPGRFRAQLDRDETEHRQAVAS